MIPFVGPSYSLNTRKADVQRTVNMYPVVNEVQGGKSSSYLESIPGLVVFGTDGPGPGPGCRYVFLDTFANEGEPQVITDHAQDVPLRGSIWDVNDTTFWQVYGGKANSVEESLMGNTTSFGGFSTGYPLMAWGWKFECEIEVPAVSPSEFAYVSCAGYAGHTEAESWESRTVELEFRCLSSGEGGGFSIKVGDDVQVFDVSPGMHKFEATMNQAGMVVTMDGVQLEVGGEPYVFTDRFLVPYSVGLWAQSLVPNSYMNVGMVGIFTCDNVETWHYPD